MDLSEQIRLSASELERKVEERTKELLESRVELEKKNMKLRAMARDLKGARDRYWNLYNWSPLGYLSLDGSFIIREINITGTRMLGAKRTELLGKSIEGYLSPENMALLADALKKCVTEEIARLELQVTLREKQHLYVQLYCVPYQRPGFAARMYRTALVDITGLKEAEERVYRLNRLYSMLTATGKAIVRATGQEDLFREICRISVEDGGFAQACIGLIDAEGRAVHPVASCTDGEVQKRQPYTCFAEKLDETCPVTTAIKENSYFVINDCLNDPAAGYSHMIAKTYGFRSTAAYALQLEGKAAGAFNIFSREVDYFDQQMVELLNQMTTDISFRMETIEKERLRQEAEEALRRETLARLEAVEDLRRKEHLLVQQNRLAAMGEMIGNVAHQWRQPLNLLGLLVQDLPLAGESGIVDQEYLQKQAAKAMEVIEQMSGTIDDFRNFFQSDKEMVSFRLNEVVRRTVSFIEAAFRAGNIRVELLEEEDLFITGYMSQFSQVILNLLMNAREVFIERNIENPKVNIRIFRKEGSAAITVADNGGGIADEILDKVFEPFFTTKGPKGTGIGLFMSRTIIEKNMGGTLTVRNTEEGAEFRIEV